MSQYVPLPGFTLHALKGNEAEARFLLNCPEGPPVLWDYEGFRLSELNEIGELIAKNLEVVCLKWREYHG